MLYGRWPKEVILSQKNVESRKPYTCSKNDIFKLYRKRTTVKILISEKLQKSNPKFKKKNIKKEL